MNGAALAPGWSAMAVPAHLSYHVPKRRRFLSSPSPMTSPHLKPTHKAIQAYHAKIREYDAGAVGHESGRSPAFHNLLEETAKPHGWLLVDQLSLKVRGKTIRPDGTLRDAEWLFPRGYWEAKDTASANHL